MQKQERNLKTYLNNIPYEHKNIVAQHILRLIKENQKENQMWIRTDVSKNNDDTIYCYIQIASYVDVGDKLIEIKILFPHNYPVAPPQFHLAYQPESYSIQNQQILLNDRIINFQINPAKERFINLNFPFLKVYWRSQRRNVTEAYAEMKKCLNNPPLLVPRTVVLQPSRADNLRVSMRAEGSLLERFTTEVELQALEIQEAIDQVEKEERLVDESLSRVDFFKRNLPKLARSMKNYEDEVGSRVVELQSISQSLTFQRNCDPLLDINEPTNAKLSLLGTRQGYLQAQRRLWRCLQSELQQTPSRFKDFRPLIRTLYEGMFTVQSSYLRASD